jgi:AraC family transcriptional regulator
MEIASLYSPQFLQQLNGLHLVAEKNQMIPNAVQYKIKRFKAPEQWQYTNLGQLTYHYHGENHAENKIELKFCLIIQNYCNTKKTTCDFCKDAAYTNCNDLVPTIDFVSIQITHNHLKQFFSADQYSSFVENVIQFKHHENFSTSIEFNNAILKTLQNILNHNYNGSFENIYFNAQTQMLLLQCFNQFVNNANTDEMVFNCKFLATDTEREKISLARNILLEQIGEPLTIKALSRKVAINECYLKKGFKEMYGQTIFDFYQSQRMEHAKYLLYTKKLTVTEVSDKLGYSSISHFSTAFKKLTGLKPCDLLNY